MTTQTEITKLVDHLFRHESGKMVAVLTRIFGSENIDLAEDVVQDSLIEALKMWTYKGVPDNPSAWLFKVAKNKALNSINQEKYKRRYAADRLHFLQSEWTVEPAMNHVFSEKEIFDDQLSMIFTCCHPAITPDSQVALTLKTLCGFSIQEISKAFFTTEANIHKRLVRARKKIREDKIPFEVPVGKDLQKRLQTVLETIYLLFNEGYSASTGENLIRYEVCEEAIRLTEIIALHPSLPNKSEVFALLSLMQLNASRFNARQDDNGNILTLDKQNRLQWDYALMEKGFENLEKSAGSIISIYHILATISAYHCSATTYIATDWHSILSLYDKLVQIDQSPIVLLNRAIALSKVRGSKKAIDELKKIEEIPSIKLYHLFYSTKAAFQIELNQFDKAIITLKKAIELAPLPSEKSLLREKLIHCHEKIL